MKKFPVKQVVAVGIGAALFFVVGRFVAIPSPVPNTNITIQYGILGFLACVFGPVVGILAGLIGHALIDASYGYGIWWSWVIASGIFGLLVGFGCKKVSSVIDDGVFSWKEILTFNVVQLIAHVVCWGVIAPVLDILIYQEPIEKLFAQGLVAGIGNFVTTAIVGTLLLLAYAKAKPRKGSLKEEA
ncbi:MAG: ECF-type riboflavin transporter substrate-binding protein [Lachnospiraceae bacterium]|nr:ECF-type riboflavin transporter substrate-binding protein [Lachnospiraceae bacterium]